MASWKCQVVEGLCSSFTPAVGESWCWCVRLMNTPACLVLKARRNISGYLRRRRVNRIRNLNCGLLYSRKISGNVKLNYAHSFSCRCFCRKPHITCHICIKSTTYRAEKWKEYVFFLLLTLRHVTTLFRFRRSAHTCLQLHILDVVHR